MSQEFTEGDLVKVDLENSPFMKIKTLRAKKALCVWFDKNQKYHEVLFNIED
jgi:uncharacterized protein YodC (DUF2158 family)